jgi:hypothetical protein
MRNRHRSCRGGRPGGAPGPSVGQVGLPAADRIGDSRRPISGHVHGLRQRVCDALGKFHNLADRKWSAETWYEYRRFIAKGRKAAPAGFRLRDCDRWLWGKASRRKWQRGPACWLGSSLTRFADYRPDDREKVGGVDRFRQKMVPAARAGREIRDMAGHDHRRGSEPRCAVGQ